MANVDCGGKRTRCIRHQLRAPAIFGGTGDCSCSLAFFRPII